MAGKKNGLGRGLDALFSENTGEPSSSVELKITELEPNRDQPRHDFDEAAIDSLAESIREYGLLQPITVRPLGGRYQIVAGERRWRAAMRTGLSTVPVIIRELDDAAVAELALIENLQREDLNPIEEAEAYRRLSAVYGLSQETIAAKVGRSRPAVANALRLLELDPETLALVREGKLSASAARTMLAALTPEILRRMREAALHGASIRELERMAKGEPAAKPTPAPKPSAGRKPVYYKEAELSLSEELHRRVRITGDGEGGTLSVSFYSEDDLKAFVRQYLTKE